MLRYVMTETRWHSSGDSACLRSQGNGFPTRDGRPAKAEQIPQGRQT